MKVFLNSVLEKNLGDDLFIKIICDRYKNSEFYVINKNNYRIDSFSKNLNIINCNKTLYKIFRKIAYVFKTYNFIDRYHTNKADIVITLGGSMFMEGKQYKQTKKAHVFSFYKKLKKDFYIIGANVGPIYTKEYIDRIRKDIMSKARDVCFRDKKSKSYFNGLTNIRVAPDIVFSLDTEKYKSIKEEKKVVISVIDIETKKNQIKNPNILSYDEIICKIIKEFQKKDYKIQLMSFCKDEGDEIAINRIMDKIENKTNVEKYFYDGNIEEALEEIAKARIVVGTRFHANVIGLVMNKKIVPISYNDKTINMLDDISFKGIIFDVNKMDKVSNKEISQLDLDNKLDISRIKKYAEKHFKIIDKIL